MRFHVPRWMMVFAATVAFYLWLNQPFVRGTFFPSSADNVGYHGKFNLGYHHKFPDYLFKTKYFFDQKREQFQILLFPPSRANVYEWGYGGVSDVTLLLLNRGLLFRPWGEGYVPPNGIEYLYNLTAQALLDGNGALAQGLLRMLNARYLLQRNDFVYNFYHEELNSPSTIKKALIRSGLTLKTSIGKWDIYELPGLYMPLVYGARRTFFIAGNQIAGIVSSPTFDPQSAIYLSNEGRRVRADMPDQASPAKIEFKKISPAKYRIRLHGVLSQFPLILGQAYHKGWRLYQNPSPDLRTDAFDLKDYRIFENNEEDQATADELSRYVSQKLVTTLGDGRRRSYRQMSWKGWREQVERTFSYTIDFVSKDRLGTIQNDNLPDGSFFETWFYPEVSSEFHDRANYFANSWIIDPKVLSLSEKDKRPDGSYDVELVAEFATGRIFYLGCFLSVVTLLVCATWYFRTKKTANLE
jgi:hypothetical protein